MKDCRCTICGNCWWDHGGYTHEWSDETLVYLDCKHCGQEIEHRGPPSMGGETRAWWVHIEHGTRHCVGVTGRSNVAEPEETL